MIIIYSLLFVLISAGFLIFPSLNSDSLYIEVFQSSFLRDISMGDIWLQMPASAYFPDQLIYFLSRKIFDINQSLFIVALSKIFLLSGSIFYFCKNVINTSSKKSLLIGFIVSSIFCKYSNLMAECVCSLRSSFIHNSLNLNVQI